jgi:hypothetical protein
MIAAESPGVMAKLHKEKRLSRPLQNARHSTSTQPKTKAVRLTPAEIRAQNNGELSRSQSQLEKDPSRQLSEGHVTPPPSPTKEQSAYQTQLARSASQSQRPPTPPSSPRISHAKTTPTRQNGFPIPQPLVSQYRQSMPIEAYRGIVGTPAPTSSRTSSISSIRAPMKYRGHEITRTGSLSMFQAPQPDIVMNPLSNFSRPRNKYSPPGSSNRQDGNMEPYQAQHRRNDTTDSGVSLLLSRSESPMMRNTSPVSSRTTESLASRQFVIVTEDSLPKIENRTASLLNTEDRKDDVAKPPMNTFPAIRPMDSPKLTRDMNKSSSVNLDKAVNSGTETEAKKKRRHTFSWKRMSGMDPKKGSKNDLSQPKEEAVAAASRPQSAEEPAVEEVTAPTKEDKGKGKEVVHDHGPPVIGVRCCDKCGRIRKLQDGKPVVADGKANETLVIAGSSAYKLITTRNDMPGPSAVNPAGAANAAQLIMHRQRRPKPEPAAVLPNDHVVKDFAASPTPAAVAHEVPQPIQRNSADKIPEPPLRLTRFASLYGLSSEKEIASSMPTLKTNLNDNAAEAIPNMKATSTPIDEPLPEFIYNSADDEDHFVEAPTQQRRYSFESQRSVIDVTPPEKPAPEVVSKPREPIDLSKPIMLPEPNLGLHFARSNLTLRGLVIPKGGSSANLLADMVARGETDEVQRGLEQSDQMDQIRRERQARVGEIMAL